MLARGEVGEAVRWASARGLRADDQPSYPREGEYLILARVLLATQQQDQALRLLARLHSQAATQARTGSLIEIRALQALGRQAAGDPTGALTVLAEALALASCHYWRRHPVDVSW